MKRYKASENPHFAKDVLMVSARHQLCYPHFRLVDLYKSFFQDIFGPGHLLDDEKSALDALDQELAMMKSQGRKEVEPCGFGENFCRIPLDLVVDQVVDKRRYQTHFIASAHSYALPSLKTWSAQWHSIVSTIESNEHQIDHFDEDRRRIEQLLDSGSYVMSHSEGYRSSYRPHYRIFSIQEAHLLLAGR